MPGLVGLFLCFNKLNLEIFGKSSIPKKLCQFLKFLYFILGIVHWKFVILASEMVHSFENLLYINYYFVCKFLYLNQIDFVTP